MSDIIKYYQSIPELGIEGRMNTPEEFDKIGLPKDLTGNHILDIGCNMGAFLLESFKRGADVLIGVEPNNDWRLLAKGVLFDVIDDVVGADVYDIIEAVGTPFDLVLLLSITHVVDNPQELIDKAWELTKQGGLLIIEVNDRLQEKEIKLPEGGKLIGKNKDNRSVWHFVKE